MTLGYLFISVVLVFAGCGKSDGTNSNSGPDRTSLPTPPANSNASVNSNTSVANTMVQKTFWTEAAIGGMTEVELGKMASSKAQSADVKSFGQMMVTDHSKANEELKGLAAKKNVTLPTAPDEQHRSTIEKMQKLSGAEFDRAYVDDMLEDHEADVKEFEKQSKENPDPDLKAFAAKTLPTLRKHLDTIKSIHAKMK